MNPTGFLFSPWEESADFGGCILTFFIVALLLFNLVTGSSSYAHNAEDFKIDIDILLINQETYGISSLVVRNCMPEMLDVYDKSDSGYVNMKVRLSNVNPVDLWDKFLRCELALTYMKGMEVILIDLFLDMKDTHQYMVPSMADIIMDSVGETLTKISFMF
ncbi:hypothetical protein Tco_0341336 [Tanacetum coccineum]